MIDAVSELAKSFEEETIGYRRDFHRYAESGWTEFRTASLVARRLTDLGYDVQLGGGHPTQWTRTHRGAAIRHGCC
jgi:aminobenzoyl-glutamate utilization protein A